MESLTPSTSVGNAKPKGQQMAPTAASKGILLGAGPPSDPRLRWRLLFTCLPFAGGAGLVVHILAGISLPLAIGVLALLAATVWIGLLRRLPSGTWRLLRVRALVGATAGLVGTIAYDLARYGTVALFSMSFRPFHVWTVFGEAFIGQGHSVAALTAVGAIYHLSNGTFFGLAYSLVFRRPRWWTGMLWGVGLELTMATLYPRWLRLQAWGEFLQVSAVGHLVYGATLGLLAGWGVRLYVSSTGRTRKATSGSR
jgi:hypothetical protein